MGSNQDVKSMKFKSMFSVACAVALWQTFANLCQSVIRLESQSVVPACVLKIASEWWVWKFICRRPEVKNSSPKGRETTTRALCFHNDVGLNLNIKYTMSRFQNWSRCANLRCARINTLFYRLQLDGPICMKVYCQITIIAISHIVS